MATQRVTLGSHPGKVGTTIKLLDLNTLLTVQASPASEPEWNSGQYAADFTDVPAGSYRVIHCDASGRVLWTSFVVLTFTSATFHAHDAALLDSQLSAVASASATAVISALGSGTEVFGHSYLESIKRIEVSSGAATLSGAGSGTEIMTSSDGSKTATFTVDASGNVSAVVWT